ncbi:MAG: MBL fold metallo-hydrolase [Bacteroidales bacterium]|jgi:7,8-dihydropterin-6-yl-methyl-4-(beta-D-ribofuranosyl)aminobenzene 5'-phosphate synthase
MKIAVLAENSVCQTNSRNVKSEHGISLFIEFGERKILFDTGQSDLFIRNAIKMGIDLSEIDYVIISHGHFDRGGGLKHFLNLNRKAKVYLHRLAFHKFYTKISTLIPYYVGLDQKLFNQYAERIHFIDKDTSIDQDVLLVEGFPSGFPQPEANKALFEKLDKQLIPDMFRHELAMVLTEHDELVIFSGCSHSGIMNIIEKVRSVFPDEKIKAVFGGLHIHNPISKKDETPAYIAKLTAEMQVMNLVFYTGHCTGEANFRSIREKLGMKIQTMNTGELILVR